MLMNTIMRDNIELTCVRGIVVPWSWDEDGAVVEIVIDAQEEQRYFPVPMEKNRELAAHFRCSVEVFGIIESRHDEKLYLEVREYRIIKNPGHDVTGKKRV